MSKRTLLLVLALIVSLAVASTGTLAYLTATDSDVNVMTLGNVDIEQHEMKRAEGIAHNATLADGDLVPFEEGIKLYPAYPVNNAATDYSAEETDLLKWGPYVHTGTAQNGLWNDSKLVGAVDKMVFVENTGSSDAYFRTVIAYECPEGIEIGEPSQGAEIMINENSVDLYGAMTERFVDYITVDGVRYKMFQYVYADALLPGEWAHPSLLQVVMTHNATSEDMTLLGETYEILVVTQAVATENMPEDAAEALNAAFGELSADSHPWMAEGEEGAQPPYENEPPMPLLVSTADELKEALKTPGATVALTKNITLTKGIAIADGVTLNLNGYTITDASDAGRTLGIQNGVNVTVGGEGTIVGDSSVTSTYDMPFYVSNAQLTVNDGTYQMDASSKEYNCLLQKEAKMVINGGTFTTTGDHPLFSVIYSSTLEINGGHFECIGKANPNMFDVEYHNTRISTIIFRGGTFVNYNPLEDDEGIMWGDGARVFVADGYTVTSETQPNGDVWYTVVPK